MPNPFSSPKLTLRRAHQHILDFKTLASGLLAHQPWPGFIEHDPNLGANVLKIRFPQVPEMLPCVLFDAANNLRCVLDQCGYATAIAANCRTKAIKFPVSRTEEEFRNNAKGCCADLPSEIQTIFRSFQAYLGGDSASIAVINTVANDTKHFSIRPLVIANTAITFSAQIDAPSWRVEVSSFAAIGWDAEKGEISLASLPGGPAKANVHSNIAFDIAIDGIEAVALKPASAVLDDAFHKVKGVLMATEAECRRIGLIP